ncbi:MAG TPA: helicase-associated domain-containing protein [Ktedonobacterales bacterium]
MSDRQTDASDPASAPAGLDEAVRMQRDLYLVWREVAAAGGNGLALTARGYLPRAALRRLRERTSAALGGDVVGASGGRPLLVSGGRVEASADATEPEDARIFFIRRLLERLSLLHRVDHEDGGRDGGHDGHGGTRLVAAERALIERYLAHPLAERVRIGVRLWVAGGWWPDAVDPAAIPPRAMVPAPPRIAVARRRLIEDLLELAPGDVLAVPPASGAAFASSRRVRAGRSRVHSAASAAGADATGEAATRRAALLGPLAWLGVAAPARDERTVRVAAGIGALRPEPVELPERHGRVVLQSDFSIVAYPPLTAPELLLLDGCAREEALDATARYRLGVAAFAQAHDRGWGAAEVAARLEALGGTALPQNVRATLDDWARNAERLRLTSNATILTVREAKLLDALLADPGCAGWVTRRLGPLHALLAPDAAHAVRGWLLRKGELPAMRGKLAG